MATEQPWKPAEATNEINKLAKDQQLRITYTSHARERLVERDLTTSDALYVLKHGFVYEDPMETTQAGLFKYRVESRSPNSGSRTVRAVVIPDPARRWMKMVTIMYMDES